MCVCVCVCVWYKQTMRILWYYVPPSATAAKPDGSTGFAVPCLVGSEVTVAGIPATFADHSKVRELSLPPLAVGESPHKLQPGSSSGSSASSQTPLRPLNDGHSTTHPMRIQRTSGDQNHRTERQLH